MFCAVLGYLCAVLGYFSQCRGNPQTSAHLPSPAGQLSPQGSVLCWVTFQYHLHMTTSLSDGSHCSGCLGTQNSSLFGVVNCCVPY
jgi:hypothetical protein